MKTFLIGLFVLVPAAAWACVGQPCRDPFAAAVTDGGQLPSNVPALVLSSPIVSRPLLPTEARIELQRADGGQLEVDVSSELGGRQVLVRPRAALPIGETLHLRYPLLCDGGVGAPLYDAPFSVGESAPLPTSLGALSVKEESRGVLSVYDSAACNAPKPATWATLGFVPSRELLPYLATTRWSLVVDGVEWTTATVGAIRADGTLAGDRVGKRVLEPHGSCSGAYQALSEGRHQVQLKGFIAGVAEPLSLTTQITLSCGGSFDGGQLETDGGVSLPMTPEPPPAGCSAAPGVMGWLALGWALRLLRRR